MGSNTLAITNRQWIWISGFIDLAGPCCQWGGLWSCRNPYISECGCGRQRTDVADVVAGVNIGNIEQQQHVRGLDFGLRLCRLCRRTYNNHLT